MLEASCFQSGEMTPCRLMRDARLEVVKIGVSRRSVAGFQAKLPWRIHAVIWCLQRKKIAAQLLNTRENPALEFAACVPELQHFRSSIQFESRI